MAEGCGGSWQKSESVTETRFVKHGEEWNEGAAEDLVTDLRNRWSLNCATTGWIQVERGSEASDLRGRPRVAARASMLACYWSAVFVLLTAALSALYARRGHSKASPEPLPTVMPTLLTDCALSEENSARARSRARKPAAETSVAAPDTSDGSSESDSNDDGLQSLLQMHAPALRVAEPSMRMRSPTVLQPNQSAASTESELPEAGWGAAATPRKRAARAASCDPAAAKPSALPAAGGTADASDALEDWDELDSAHSKVRRAPGSTRYPPHPFPTLFLCVAPRRTHHTGARASTATTCA